MWPVGHLCNNFIMYVFCLVKLLSQFDVCMELMHDFVKGYVYCILGKYMYLEAPGYLICDARTKWMVKHYKLNTPGPRSGRGKGRREHRAGEERKEIDAFL